MTGPYVPRTYGDNFSIESRVSTESMRCVSVAHQAFLQEGSERGSGRLPFQRPKRISQRPGELLRGAPTILLCRTGEHDKAKGWVTRISESPQSLGRANV